MRKIFTLAICLMTSLASLAQATDNSFAFIDADGNTVADGSVLTRTETTEELIESYISSGLFVQNVTDGAAYLKIETNIKEMPTGTTHSICFPGNCVRTQSIGTGESPNVEGEKAGSKNSMQAEWIHNGTYGTCTVTYTIKVYSYDGKQRNKFGIMEDVYTLIGDGPSVTINYVNADPAGIDNTNAEAQETSTAYYDLQGRRMPQPGKGLYIKKAKLANGSTKTVKVVLR